MAYDADLTKPDHIAEAISDIAAKFEASPVEEHCRTVKIKVSGMASNHCVQTIETKLGAEDGILGEKGSKNVCFGKLFCWRHML